MYAFIEGKFEFKSPDKVIITNNGIGYELQITLNTFSTIQKKEHGRLYTYFHVREDIQALYGFYSLEEKETFLLLLTVNGVGTSSCRIILSTLSPNEVKNSILSEQNMSFQKVKGIGKKTAERIVLELKDKILKTKKEPQEVDFSTSQNVRASTKEDAINAIINLGIAKPNAMRAVEKAYAIIEDKKDLPLLIKEALKHG